MYCGTKDDDEMEENRVVRPGCAIFLCKKNCNFQTREEKKRITLACILHGSDGNEYATSAAHAVYVNQCDHKDEYSYLVGGEKTFVELGPPVAVSFDLSGNDTDATDLMLIKLQGEAVNKVDCNIQCGGTSFNRMSELLQRFSLI